MDYPTPEEAELAFYQAIADGDLKALMDVWLGDESVFCIHPMREPVFGHALVKESWAPIVQCGEVHSIRFGEVHRSQGPMLAVHVGKEFINEARSGRGQPNTSATNVYQLGGRGWQMLAHHASPILPQEIPDPNRPLH